MGSMLFQEITSLETVVRDAVSGTDSASLLQPAADAAARLVHADRVSLILFEPESRSVTHFLRGGPGWEGVFTTIGFGELSQGLSGWVLRTGEPALSPGGAPDPRESEAARIRRAETHCGAILVVPLGTPGHRTGTLTAIRNPGEADFTGQDADDLGIFARFAWAGYEAARAQHEVQKAHTETRYAVQSKLNFLSNLSHELRTPLNGILGFSHLLESTALDAFQKTMVQTVVQSGQRLLGTVDNILELAQFESGQFHLETTPFSPRSVLDAVMAKHQSEALEKGLRWEVSHAPDLPAVLEGDPVRLGQAWGHVLSNAVKFTSQGSVTIHLSARARRGRRYELVLTVEDTGIGVETDTPGHWSRPFHQGDGSFTRKFGGTGLGLALCDRITRAMDGGLSMKGERGQGTSVRVSVDLSAFPARNPIPGPLHFLVLTADAAVRQTLVGWLEESGHRVDLAPTLVQAEDMLGSDRYDLLISDAQGYPGLGDLAARWSVRGLSVIGIVPEGTRAPEPGIASLTLPISIDRLDEVVDFCLHKGTP